MAHVSLKRNFEEDISETPANKTPKRRCCSPTNVSSTKIYKITEDSPSSNKMALRSADNDKEETIKHHQKCQQLCSEDENNTNYSSMSKSSTKSEITHMGPDWKEKPLFTYEQVLLMCGNVLKERENEIRNEYDRILNTKLGEQHEKFVKFIYGKIQEQYENRTPSYLS